MSLLNVTEECSDTLRQDQSVRRNCVRHKPLTQSQTQGREKSCDEVQAVPFGADCSLNNNEEDLQTLVASTLGSIDSIFNFHQLVSGSFNDKPTTMSILASPRA